jgi:hypothetical protein
MRSAIWTRTPVVRPFLAAAVAACALCGAALALASAPPVGPLPPSKVQRISTARGSLVSVAVPKRPGGYVWRIARTYNGHVLREVTEGDVGSTVVIVFRAVGPGTTTVVLAETRGETAKAYRAARYVVTVT